MTIRFHDGRQKKRQTDMTRVIVVFCEILRTHLQISLDFVLECQGWSSFAPLCCCRTNIQSALKVANFLTNAKKRE